MRRFFASVLSLVFFLAACDQGGNGGVIVTQGPLPPPEKPRAVVTAPPPAAFGKPTPTREGPAIAAFVLEASESTMVKIPAGPFIMGSGNADPDESPPHEVTLSAFQIDRFEATNEEFRAFVQATGYQVDAEKAAQRNWKERVTDKANHPVVMVSWNDAAAYCEWMGKRLPTEEEWEKAARGTDKRIYPWGNQFDDSRANVKLAGLRGTAAVGSFPAGASPYGVEDMAGNVWEWTSSPYRGYPGSTYKDPYYGERLKVTRGGGWFDDERQVRTTNRSAANPSTANDDIGFRCVK